MIATSPITTPLLALVTAVGVYLLYSAWAYGWRHIGSNRSHLRRRVKQRCMDLLAQAGLARVRPRHVVSLCVLAATCGGTAGFAMYGGLLPSLVIGASAGVAPIAYLRNLRSRRRELARDVWPALLERTRIGIVSLGQSVPQALFAAARELDGPMRDAFDTAHREWLISTDFRRTLDVLAGELADPTADAVCETLVIAHSVGGQNIDQRLRRLIDDRMRDVQARRDARAKQAGVRFARWFVLLVPFGMAAVGLLIGDGRAAYASPMGQATVLVALGCIGACWVWAGSLLRLPHEQRVLRIGEPLRQRPFVRAWRRT